MPTTPPKKMIRLDEDIYQAVRIIAFQSNISTTKAINTLVRQCLEMRQQTLTAADLGPVPVEITHHTN